MKRGCGCEMVGGGKGNEERWRQLTVNRVSRFGGLVAVADGGGDGGVKDEES